MYVTAIQSASCYTRVTMKINVSTDRVVVSPAAQKRIFRLEQFLTRFLQYLPQTHRHSTLHFRRRWHHGMHILVQAEIPLPHKTMVLHEEAATTRQAIVLLSEQIKRAIQKYKTTHLPSHADFPNHQSIRQNNTV